MVSTASCKSCRVLATQGRVASWDSCPMRWAKAVQGLPGVSVERQLPISVALASDPPRVGAGDVQDQRRRKRGRGRGGRPRR